MKNDHSKRTASFRWNTRLELYDFFHLKYGLSKEQVDNEIDRVMAKFRPRKGQVIRTQELWQKVGMILESEKKDAKQKKFNLQKS